MAAREPALPRPAPAVTVVDGDGRVRTQDVLETGPERPARRASPALLLALAAAATLVAGLSAVGPVSEQAQDARREATAALSDVVVAGAADASSVTVNAVVTGRTGPVRILDAQVAGAGLAAPAALARPGRQGRVVVAPGAGDQEGSGPGAGDAPAQRAAVLVLAQPSCTPESSGAPAAELRVLVAAPGGEPALLTAPLDPRDLQAATARACRPLRASAALDGPAGREVTVTLQVSTRARSGPATLLSLSGAGLGVRLEPALPRALTGPGGGRPDALEVTAMLAPATCAEGFLAPRTLTAGVRLGDGPPVDVVVEATPGLTAALDEAFRLTCRRPR